LTLFLTFPFVLFYFHSYLGAGILMLRNSWIWNESNYRYWKQNKVGTRPLDFFNCLFEIGFVLFIRSEDISHKIISENGKEQHHGEVGLNVQESLFLKCPMRKRAVVRHGKMIHSQRPHCLNVSPVISLLDFLLKDVFQTS